MWNVAVIIIDAFLTCFIVAIFILPTVVVQDLLCIFHDVGLHISA